MRKSVKYLLVLSALIPATCLVILCLVVIINNFIERTFELEEVGYLLTSIFGMIGYIGLVLLLIKQNVERNKSTLFLLISGVVSFTIFSALGESKA
jgi:hypothetical protein